MKNLLNLFILLVLISCGSSKEEEGGLKVFDLDQEFPKKELGIEDLMEEPELVILETTNESLIPQRFDYLVGEKYILTKDQDRVLVFARNGSFIKQLAYSGRGPGEFVNNLSWILSQDEEKLYMSNLGDGNALLAYSIADGTFNKIEYPSPLLSMVMLDKEWMMGAGNRRTFFKTFELNLNTGEVRNLIEQTPPENQYFDKIFLSKDVDQIYYSDNDTLHILEDGYKTPLAVFTIDNPENISTSTSVTTFELLIANSDYIILSKTKYPSDNDLIYDDNGNVLNKIVKTLYLDRSSNKMYEMPPLGSEKNEEVNPLLTQKQSGNQRGIAFQASDWLEFIDYSNQLPNKWKDQSKSISYEDNPVIIIGKAK